MRSARGRFKRVMREGGEVGTGEAGVESALVYSGEDIVMRLMVVGNVDTGVSVISSTASTALGFCRRKSSINCSALIWLRGSQLSCASENPFHLTKYCSWLCLRLAPRICSTSVMITLPEWTCTIFSFLFPLYSTRAHATQPLLRVDSRTMTHLLVSDSFLG
jgi:hypothetical protein